MKLKHILFIITFLFYTIFAENIKLNQNIPFSGKTVNEINSGGVYEKPNGKLIGMINQGDTLKIILKKGNWIQTEKGWVESTCFGIDKYNYLSYNLYTSILSSDDIQNSILNIIGKPDNILDTDKKIIYYYNDLFDQRFDRLELKIDRTFKTITAIFDLKQPITGDKSIKNMFELPENLDVVNSIDNTQWIFGVNPTITVTGYKTSQASYKSVSLGIKKEKSEGQFLKIQLSGFYLAQLYSSSTFTGTVTGLLFGPGGPIIIYTNKDNLESPCLKNELDKYEQASSSNQDIEYIKKEDNRIFYQNSLIFSSLGAIIWTIFILNL